MAVDFNYSNSIDAGTPAAAGEIQGNFADLLAWIKSYYQQEADATAGTDAAIANYNPTRVLDWSRAAGGVGWAIDTSVALPGLQVSWTAEASHLYRIDVQTNQLQFGWTAGMVAELRVGSTVSVLDAAVARTTFASTSASSNFLLSGSEFVSGISGATTYFASLYRYFMPGADESPVPGATCFSGTSGHIVVSDLGVAP